MTYCARLKFLCSEGWFLVVTPSEPDKRPEDPDSITLAGGLLSLSTAVSGQRFSNSRWFVLRRRNLPSAVEARDVGLALRDALQWASTRIRIGLDLGDDRPHGCLTNDSKLTFERENEVRLKSDVHGLVVVDESKPTQFGWNQSQWSHGIGVERFGAAIMHAHEKQVRFSDHERTAFELYNLAHFDASPRARLLTLTSAIEALCEPRTLSKEVVEHVARLGALELPTGMGTDEGIALRRGIERLSQESISSACRRLVATLLPSAEDGKDSALHLFQRAYKARSGLLHTGSSSVVGIDFTRLVNSLDMLVSRLLIAHVDHREAGRIGDFRSPYGYSDAGQATPIHDDETADENYP